MTPHKPTGGEIPADVMATAKAVYSELLDVEPSSREAELVVARAILAERAAQRERDAVEAQAIADRYGEGAIGAVIASAIRGGE